MRNRTRVAICCVGTLSALLAAGGAVAQTDDATEDEMTVRRVDFSGRPPFKRELVRESEETAEFARFEENVVREVPEPGETILIVDRRGKPPFRRQRVEITAENAVDFARFEEVETEDEPTRRRHGPPGKGFYRSR